MLRSIDTALRYLRSESSTERLQAARYFAEHAQPAHEARLREALAKETVPWIRGALRRALARISPTTRSELYESVDRDDAPAAFAAEVFADAVEATTSQLMHEIEPLLGTLRLAAEQEIANFSESRTSQCLDRLDSFLDALSRLRRAAVAPKLEEFALDELVSACIQAVSPPDSILIQRAGPQHCIVEGDSSLVALAIANGLRNAIDATRALGNTSDPSDCPITISWQKTDRDTWVSIVDLGIGFKGNLSRAFDIGTTTKAGHLGMGLAIANQAMASMNGEVLLVPNERGVRFELRWRHAVRS